MERWAPAAAARADRGRRDDPPQQGRAGPARAGAWPTPHSRDPAELLTPCPAGLSLRARRIPRRIQELRSALRSRPGRRPPRRERARADRRLWTALTESPRAASRESSVIASYLLLATLAPSRAGARLFRVRIRLFPWPKKEPGSQRPDQEEDRTLGRTGIARITRIRRYLALGGAEEAGVRSGRATPGSRADRGSRTGTARPAGSGGGARRTAGAACPPSPATSSG